MEKVISALEEIRAAANAQTKSIEGLGRKVNDQKTEATESVPDSSTQMNDNSGNSEDSNDEGLQPIAQAERKQKNPFDGLEKLMSALNAADSVSVSGMDKKFRTNTKTENPKSMPKRSTAAASLSFQNQYDDDDDQWLDLNETDKRKRGCHNRKRPLRKDSTGSSSDSDSATMLRQAIGLNQDDIKDFDGKSAPTNGSQYLLSVMMERKRTSKISVGKNIRKKAENLKKKSVPVEVVKPEEELKLQAEQFQEMEGYVNRSIVVRNTNPCTKWESDLLNEFKRLREKLNPIQEEIVFGRREFVSSVDLPSITNEAHWKRAIFGKMLGSGIEAGNFNERKAVNLSVFFTSLRFESSTTTAGVPVVNCDGGAGDEEAIAKEEDIRKLDPVLSILIGMPQRTLMSLINLQVSWLKEYSWIHNDQAQWLYALLVCLLEPIEPQTIGDLREIYKICKALKDAQAFIGSKELVEEFECVLNLFIVIVKYGFKQWDLL